MKTRAEEFASPEVLRTVGHLGSLVRDARLARGMPQSELAARARISAQTIMRIEAGSPATSVGNLLSAMEQLGLLTLLTELRDRSSEHLLSAHKPRRARPSPAEPDMDF
jgi:ribosome-binding protein aMBF1 (putative translation factor)